MPPSDARRSHLEKGRRSEKEVRVETSPAPARGKGTAGFGAIYEAAASRTRITPSWVISSPNTWGFSPGR